jgi:hypothetical protein
MPVPSSIDDLSQTAGSNSPPGSESPTTADDYLRTYAAFIAILRDGKGHSDEVQVASAATADIGGANSLFVEITGTTTITSFGTTYNGPRFVRFSGALTLTHNATSLIIPGGANVTTAAGDCAVVIPNGGSPNGWRVVSYFKAALVPGTATNVTGTVAIANGGTGQTTASAAFNALKQDATESETGVVEKLTTAEAQAGTDDTRYHSAATMKAAQIQLGTPVTLSTQTNVDFTSIPSWAKRIDIMWADVSTNGSSNPIVQIGDSGGVETSGYVGTGTVISNGVSPTTSNYTIGFGLPLSSGANLISGSITLKLLNSATNTWMAEGNLALSNAAVQVITAGRKALSATLDRVRVTTLTGVDQFDTGTINISYE